MKAKKKVILLGGFADSLINFRGPLIADLVAAGHSVVAAAPGLSERHVTELRKLGADAQNIEVARTGTNPFGDIQFMLSIRRLIVKNKADFLLTYTAKPNIWGAFAAGLAGIPSAAMVTGLGYAFVKSGSYKQRVVGGVVKLLYRLATRFNSVVIFQNPDDLADFEYSGCLFDRVKARLVNGSGVDLTQFYAAALPDAPVFLFIGRFLGNKGVREYCEAAVAVKAQRPQTRFLLVGFVDDNPDSIKPSELEVWGSKGIELCGEATDVRPFIEQASVFVLPSYREGTPRTVLESMAMGRAIITTDAPGCRETVVDGSNGFLVPVKNVNSLAEKMILLADSSELRGKMGKASLKIATEKYDVSKVNKMLMSHIGL